MCLRVAVQVCLHLWPGERVGVLEFVVSVWARWVLLLQDVMDVLCLVPV